MSAQICQKYSEVVGLPAVSRSGLFIFLSIEAQERCDLCLGKWPLCVIECHPPGFVVQEHNDSEHLSHKGQGYPTTCRFRHHGTVKRLCHLHRRMRQHHCRDGRNQSFYEECTAIIGGAHLSLSFSFQQGLRSRMRYVSREG